MRTITLAAAFALVAGAALAADPIEGVWQTQPDEGAVALVQMQHYPARPRRTSSTGR